MSNAISTTEETVSGSRTRVVFDLRDVLSDDELERFEASAREAGAPSLTDHFLNLTLRKPDKAA
jgi:hypothetical protein